MKKINKIFTILIILLPLLYQYKSPIASIALGEFLLMPFMVIFFVLNFRGKISCKKYNGYYLYIISAIITSLITSVSSYFSYSEFSTVLLRIIYYAILIYVAYDNFDVEFSFICFKKIALVLTFYLFLQYFFYKVFNIVLPTTINKNWVFAPEVGTRLNYSVYYKIFYRPSSLFLEPSYYAFYMAPALAILLCNDNFKKRDKASFVEAIIISVGLMLCTASSSIIILLICWFAYLLGDGTKKFKISPIKIILFLLALLLICIILKSPISQTMRNRLNSGGSFNIRITRGLVLIRELDLKSMLLGVGINNLEKFVQENELHTEYDVESLGYMSSVIGTYLCSGIFVFILYLRFYITSFIKNKSILTRTMLFLLFSYSFIEMTSFTYRFAFYAIQIFALQNMDEIKRKEKI